MSNDYQKGRFFAPFLLIKKKLYNCLNYFKIRDIFNM